jgi:hypothetical protein
MSPRVARSQSSASRAKGSDRNFSFARFVASVGGFDETSAANAGFSGEKSG